MKVRSRQREVVQNATAVHGHTESFFKSLYSTQRSQNILQSLQTLDQHATQTGDRSPEIDVADQQGSMTNGAQNASESDGFFTEQHREKETRSDLRSQREDELQRITQPMTTPEETQNASLQDEDDQDHNDTDISAGDDQYSEPPHQKSVKCMDRESETPKEFDTELNEHEEDQTYKSNADALCIGSDNILDSMKPKYTQVESNPLLTELSDILDEQDSNNLLTSDSESMEYEYAQLVDQLEDIVNKEMVNLMSTYDNANPEFSAYTNGIISCPLSDCATNTPNVPVSNSSDKATQTNWRPILAYHCDVMQIVCGLQGFIWIKRRFLNSINFYILMSVTV
eukprot:731588_1